MAGKSNRDGEFASNLRGLRAMRDMTQEDLARRVGVSVQSVQNWENGSNMPSFAVAVRLADALGCDTNMLAGRT